MNQVDPERLRQAAKLMAVVGRPGADGVNSQSRNCHLASEQDRKLHLRFTDGELAQMIAVPLSGEPVAWGLTLRSDRVRKMFSQLGHACRPAPGTPSGSPHVTVEATRDGGIQLSGGGFTGRLPGEPLANPFPNFPTPADPESWKPVVYQQLREALDFLTRGARKGKAQERPTYACLYADEIGMADQKIGFLLHYTPSLGFDAVMRTGVARQVARWLALVKPPRALESPALESAQFEWMGISYACLRADGGDRMLCFPLSREGFRRATLDDSRARPVAVIGVAARRELVSFVAIVTGMYPRAELSFSALPTPEGAWLMDATWDAGTGATSLEKRFPLAALDRRIYGVTLAPDGEQGPTRFRVRASELLAALRRFRSKSVLLAYRPAGKLLSVQDWFESYVRQEWYTEPEAFILARQQPPAATDLAPTAGAEVGLEATTATPLEERISAVADATTEVIGSQVDQEGTQGPTDAAITPDGVRPTGESQTCTGV